MMHAVQTNRTHTCSSVHGLGGSLGGEVTMESEVWGSPGAGRSDTGLRPSTSFLSTLVAG